MMRFPPSESQKQMVREHRAVAESVQYRELVEGTRN